jgi:hypothetical protein
MSVFSKRNIDQAKNLFERNKDKIADGVSKATDTIDKKTGGKHSDKLRKVDDAARKITGQAGDAADGDPAAASQESGGSAG